MKLFLGTFMIFSCTLLLFTTSGNAEQKMHELENYYVVYDISGNTTGTKKHASQDYGRKQCWIEVSDMNIMGNSVKKNEKVITMIEGGDQWIITINLDDNTGTKMKNPMYKGLTAGMEGKSPKEFSEQFMKQMGGQQKGQKTVNGEKCTEWTLMGGAKTCVTEDLIALESGADMAGINILEVATEVKRNDPGPKGICDIGDAKIKEIDLGQMMGQ
ncbi:MAG: hypothetical protein WBC96_08925 [Thermodesulfobacteriota bacterium]